MPRLHRTSDAKYDKSGMVLLNHDCKKKRKSKKNERPFQEEGDSFVRVPSMKKLHTDCFKRISGDIPSDKVMEAINIIEKFQLSWVTRIQSVTDIEMEQCAPKLKELFKRHRQAKENRLDTIL